MSVLRSRAKVSARRARINDTNAKEIKGFPPYDCSRALKSQHNFANMFAALHASVCVRRLFQRESAIDQGFDAPLAQKRHHLGLDGRDHGCLIRITTGSECRAGV